MAGDGGRWREMAGDGGRLLVGRMPIALHVTPYGT
jgi:hypothetical protein